MVIHLISEERYFAYLCYLESPAWRMLTQQVQDRCGNVCERCHKYPVEHTHHLTYVRLFHELLTDLLGVCATCHRELHGIPETTLADLGIAL